MPKFPYMNFPFPSYRTMPKPYNEFYIKKNSIINPGQTNPTPVSALNINDAYKTENTFKLENEIQKNKSNNNNDDYLFDLFGLKIYSDDVLLISLIYFLYSEGVKDDGLFLVLVLLLLS